MNNLTFLAVLVLAIPLATTAQTTTPKPTTPPRPAAQSVPTSPATPATQQVTEVTEELDPATGKVIRRTTRTTTVPAGTTAPSSTPTRTTLPGATTPSVAGAEASDVQVTNFFRQKTAVSRLTAPQLLDAYGRFIEKVRDDRHTWRTSDWTTASAVLSSLNTRYEQLRPNLSFDDKLTIRSQQAEYQALRTARQISDQVSDKL